MRELDHHPESESRYSCSHCEETGIDIESREYCAACELGKRRMNLDRLAEPLRHHPFSNAMWVAHHSAMKTERAIAAAELALLKSKLLQAERELAAHKAARIAYASEFELIDGEPDVGSIHANIRKLKSELVEVRKDADRYRWLRGCGSEWARLNMLNALNEIVPEALDAAIDAASVAQPNKEQGNG